MPLRSRLTRSAIMTLVVAVFAGTVSLLAGASPALAATRTPAVPSGLPSTIEPMTPYVGQVSCSPAKSRRGTAALARLLSGTYRAYGGSAYNTSYACGTDGTQSEHYDGRAIDWMVNVHNTKQRTAANAAIGWLLATDSLGNRFAMARRLGVMYLIWNNRIWCSWNGKWEQYNGCAKLRSRGYDNSCHRTHVHISLSWNGALGRTSYWTKHVYQTDFGPCRPKDLNWAGRYTKANYRGCQWYRKVHAKPGSSAVKKSLVTWSGVNVRTGLRGPAASAVQRAFHHRQTARFGTSDAAAVRTFQHAHRLPVTGAMNQQTWRVLLAVVR